MKNMIKQKKLKKVNAIESKIDFLIQKTQGHIMEKKYDEINYRICDFLSKGKRKPTSPGGQ